MILETTATLLLVLLVIKELTTVIDSVPVQRAAKLLYVPIAPLLVLFAAEVVLRALRLLP